MQLEPELSDALLVKRAAAGDRAAFARIVDRHYTFVHRVAWRLCGKRADADDIAQEVCVRLATAIRSFRGQSAFTTWLYTLTLNAARDLMRKTSRDLAKLDAYGIHVAVERGGHREAEPESDALWRVVRQLPDKQREAVTLVYGEGLSHSDAADVLACAEATVSWHIHEAKKRLRVLMASAGDE